MRTLRRFLPFVVLLLALIALLASGVAGQLNWASLARHQAVLAAWIARHQIIAPLLYASAYAISAALALPEGALLTIAGGLLLGAAIGGAMAVIGATAGAIVLFLAARSAFAAALAARAGPRLTRLRAELQRNGISYLLAMRLIPVFPFWLINIAAALCGMRLLHFAVGTFIGIIPGTFLYAWIGAGLADVLASGERPDLASVFTPQIIAPLVALGLLSLLPVAWQKWRRSGG